MLIDCETCVARDVACGDCVVTVFLQMPTQRNHRAVGDQPLEIDEETRAAIGSLAGAGLVPPLRLVSGMSGTDQDIA